MDISVASCWDCPMSLEKALPALLIAVVFFALAVLLLTFRSAVARAAGAVLLIAVALFYTFATVGISRYGISWRAAPMASNRVSESVLLLAWYAVTGAAAVAVIRARRRVTPGRV
jgi:hypothetical protein